MKILFTADWHIKLGQKNVPIQWQKNRYLNLFEQLNEIIKTYNIDMLIVGGDIFDRMPTIDELDLYFKFLTRLNKRTELTIYSGNHEAVKKSTTFLSSLKEVTLSLHPMLSRVVDTITTIDNIDFIPYNCLKSYYPQDYDLHGDILCTHVRGAIPPHVQPEVNLDMFSRWKLVLAGDLHSNSNSQLNILYPGSPLTTSFHRNETDTGVLVVDSDTLKHQFVLLNLPQLIRKTVSSEKDIVATDFHHTIYEVEGNIAELSQIKTSDLLDKKKVVRGTESSLNLGSELTISQELEIYLSKILKLDRDTVSKVINIFNDYTTQTKVG